MEYWQENLIEEKRLLDDKIERLVRFIDEPDNKMSAFNALPLAERYRLQAELRAMKVYTEILGERIDAFE